MSILLFIFLLQQLSLIYSFNNISPMKHSSIHKFQNLYSMNEVNENINSNIVDNLINNKASIERENLKKLLYIKCASCDRGFSALPNERNDIISIINKLKILSPEDYPTRNYYSLNKNNDVTILDGKEEENKSNLEVPLEGAWKMIYTNAFDVLVLSSNPFFITQSIYQILNRNGMCINVIDIAPRIQSFLPISIVGNGSILRLKVIIDSIQKSFDQISLNFKAIEIKPISLFNQNIQDFLPPIKSILPQSLLLQSLSSTSLNKNNNLSDKYGYFNILYLDHECLIIQQSQGGGIFVSIKDNQPIENIL